MSSTYFSPIRAHCVILYVHVYRETMPDLKQFVSIGRKIVAVGRNYR